MCQRKTFMVVILNHIVFWILKFMKQNSNKIEFY